MSEATTLREAIARALHRQATDDGEVHVLWGGIAEHEEEVAEWLPFADAVLAVLADPPADVTERAANAVHASLLDECGAGSSLLYCAPEADSYGFLEVQGAVDLPHLVRDVLRAAFGGGRDA